MGRRGCEAAIQADAGWKHVEADLDAILETDPDPAAQRAAVRRLQRRFAETVPAIPLFPSPSWGQANTTRFTGFAGGGGGGGGAEEPAQFAGTASEINALIEARFAAGGANQESEEPTLSRSVGFAGGGGGGGDGAASAKAERRDDGGFVFSTD